METAMPRRIGEPQSARAAARAALEDRVAIATRAVRSATSTDASAKVEDPLGEDGRRALMTINDSRLDHAIDEWLNASKGFWDAAHDLATLAADDDLREGRHQRIVDAGIRWRKQVLAQRRAAFVAATRTAQRALHRDDISNDTSNDTSPTSGIS